MCRGCDRPALPAGGYCSADCLDRGVRPAPAGSSRPGPPAPPPTDHEEHRVTLPHFEGRTVIRSAVKVTRAGDGLSEALEPRAAGPPPRRHRLLRPPR